MQRPDAPNADQTGLVFIRRIKVNPKVKSVTYSLTLHHDGSTIKNWIHQTIG